MCLLDAVLSWDADRITCVASSHRAPHHPMAQDGRLDALCGIEYAAQAMAVHGGLTAASLKPPKGGYLASVRDVACHVERLDDLVGDLTIVADRLLGESRQVIYRFELCCVGKPILCGRAAVVLDIVLPR
jgi:predicted hotdog family 3-hydroxylacyl-ACP dehydratase